MKGGDVLRFREKGEKKFNFNIIFIKSEMINPRQLPLKIYSMYGLLQNDLTNERQ